MKLDIKKLNGFDFIFINRRDRGERREKQIIGWLAPEKLKLKKYLGAAS